MFKHNFLLVAFLTLTSYSSANSFDSLSTSNITFGVNSGYTLWEGISTDVYSGLMIPLGKKKLEINGGYKFRKDGIDYPGEGWKNLNSHGVYIETNFYLSKRLYLGLRFAYNKYTLELKRGETFYANQTYITSDFSFTGLSGYTHIGYLLPITNNIGLKFQGQLGYHQRDYYWQDIASDTEEHYEYNSMQINLGIGLIYKIERKVKII